ncbi:MULTISPECIES: YbjQ family protein [unclassified Aureispira]|uniref:YbjQ family protein n=1 Tax=unclassified Aureispira TaxID=2649989 RepID=UPI0006968013|nr:MULTISPECIES: YbjQ family protein [unclassified Aureispira]WMX14139.1 YbjQ family protein [Aureispira sp. CCB-E]
MILSTTEIIPQRQIRQIVGLVRGNIAFARNKSRNTWVDLANLMGGEIEDFSLIQAHAREEALNKMIQAAQKLKADAIIGLRFSSTTIEGVSEILAYGTAVQLYEIE